MDPTLVLGAITALDRQRDQSDDPTTRRVRRPGKPGPFHFPPQASSEAVGRRC
jgi:hypothetical protein